MEITHLELALCCQKAYLSSTHSIKETDALIIDSDEYTIISFTGTEGDVLWPFTRGTKQAFSNWKDIINDIRFIGTGDDFNSVDIGRVHRGFMFGATKWVRTFGGEIDIQKPLYITGHSKGAAEAAQVARLLKLSDCNIKEVVLFAEPASHYSKSRKHYDSLNIKTTSYINGRDIIQYCPPWGKQSADITYIGEDGFWPSIKDHYITNYIKTMKKQ